MSCIGVRLDLTPDLLAQPARLVAPLQDDVTALVVVTTRALVAQHLGCACGGDIGGKGRTTGVRGLGVGLRASGLGVRAGRNYGLGCGVPGLEVGLRVGVRLPSTLYAAETRLKASSEPPGLSGCEASETLR